MNQQQPSGHGDSQSTPRLLVVDDEMAITNVIRLGMEHAGFLVTCATEGYQALDMAQRLRPDLVILDVMLPDLDGFEVCRRLKSNPRTADVPVVMVTALSDVADRLRGLESGADDYVTKPFNLQELVARVRALLRRQQRVVDAGGPGGRVLTINDLTLDEAAHEVKRGGRIIELTATEFNLLHLFMAHPRQVLDRQTILNRIWGYDFMGETNIIEVYVRYLREKIEDEPSAPRFIQTVRGIGYVLKG